VARYKNVLILLLVVAGVILMQRNAVAYTIYQGVPIEVIDGDGGGVLISTTGWLPGYTAGYYLNGGAWTAFSSSGDVFSDGDLLELALMDTGGSIYSLDNIAQMNFNEISGYSYYDYNVSYWDILMGPVTFTVATSNGATLPDGTSPVVPNPEPATLLLLGSCIPGLLLTGRKKMKDNYEKN
jgi:hypothetical protein